MTLPAPHAHSPGPNQSLESLLQSLEGVLSASVVVGPRGEITEVHVLSTDQVNAKRTVRNVESAIAATTGTDIDHRIISVARARSDTQPAPTERAPEIRATPDVIPLPSAKPARGAAVEEHRVLFDRYSRESDRSRNLTITVTLRFQGDSYTGVGRGFDSPQNRLALPASATLESLEKITHSDRRMPENLSLDGVKEVNALGRCFVLVAVHGISDRETKTLAGVVEVKDSREDAVIAATLQATERWITGLL